MDEPKQDEMGSRQYTFDDPGGELYRWLVSQPGYDPTKSQVFGHNEYGPCWMEVGECQ